MIEAAAGVPREWLEADGRGGFASGTADLIRTRRYHALLLSATTPPSGRVVLVNGLDAWIETAGERYAISSHRYGEEVVHPDGISRIESFGPDPWPRWIFRLEEGVTVEQEIFVSRTTGLTVISWKLIGTLPKAMLEARLLHSGRDYHALHHENPAFRFEPERTWQSVIWQPYDGIPIVRVTTNGEYVHEPVWYRNFVYAEERARGLDFREDLASPGIFRFDLRNGEAVLTLAAGGEERWEDVVRLARRLRVAERRRRSAHSSRLHRAAEDYVVWRGRGRTIVAGYPWFTDWGRDTFISLRGLCLATGRLAEARGILLEWSQSISEGMLPNRFPDRGDLPEYNSVDASLWFVVALHDYLTVCERFGERVGVADRRALSVAVEAILGAYSRGTRYGIRSDTDGLLAAGAPGVQLTWMDAKVGNWVVTPRVGKPVEVQALWVNALRAGAAFSPRWSEAAEKATTAFGSRFWNDRVGRLYDVIDCDHVPATADETFRANQILAVGGLPFPLLEGERARLVVDAVEEKLWTPMGLRTLASDDAAYVGHYAGDPAERDRAYHQGTAWPWLAGPFIEAWVRVRGDTPGIRREARRKFLEPLLASVREAGLGHISEIADGDPPHTPRGCPFQAWSVAEALRLDRIVLRE